MPSKGYHKTQAHDDGLFSYMPPASFLSAFGSGFLGFLLRQPWAQNVWAYAPSTLPQIASRIWDLSLIDVIHVYEACGMAVKTACEYHVFTFKMQNAFCEDSGAS